MLRYILVSNLFIMISKLWWEFESVLIQRLEYKFFILVLATPLRNIFLINKSTQNIINSMLKHIIWSAKKGQPIVECLFDMKLRRSTIFPPLTVAYCHIYIVRALPTFFYSICKKMIQNAYKAWKTKNSPLDWNLMPYKIGY